MLWPITNFYEYYEGVAEHFQMYVYVYVHVITKCNKVHEIVPARELNQLLLELRERIPWHTCENVDKDCLFLGRVSKQIDTGVL